MGNKRITLGNVKNWLNTWNETHPECKMTYSASLGYFGIGFLEDAGAIRTVVRGTSPRDAWEQFCIWKDGYRYGKEKI